MNGEKSRGLAADISDAVVRHWTEAAPDDRLAHLVLHVARGLRRSLELRLAEHDVPFGHWVFLRVLWLEDGLAQRELSIRAGVTEPTTHTAISKMEAMGLIERRPPIAGRRRLHVFLTDAGRALEEKLVPLAEEANAVALRSLSSYQIEQLRTSLLTMVTNLAVDETDALAEGRKVAPTRALNKN